MINAFVLIKARPDAIAELGPKLAGIDGVREAHSVAGSETDIVVVVTVADHSAIADVVTDRIVKVDGVIDTQTMIAFRSFSDAQLDAALEGFGD